jgi:Galactose oxidase, central domain
VKVHARVPAMCVFAIGVAVSLATAPTALAQGFLPTGNMTTARTSHAATLLEDGRVLITGGSSAELYDPSTGMFVKAGAMKFSRGKHAAALLRDGRVLIAGGCACFAEIYDPATATFSATGSMVATTNAESATLLRSGKVLVVGGAAPEVYDPATGIFTATPGAGALGPTALLLDGRVLIGAEPLGRVYDPGTAGFTNVSSIPTSARNGQTATALPDGQVLLAAGATDGYGEAATTLATQFDPALSSFRQAGDLVFPRGGHTATLLKDGRVLLTGGYNGNGPDSITGFLSSVEIYDPVQRIFASAVGLLQHRAGHTATMLRDGRVLIAGGYGGSVSWPVAPLSSAELFVPDYTLGVVPVLSMDSTQYCTGEGWRMEVKSAAGSTPVTLMGTIYGTPWGIPQWRSTGGNGAFAESGTFGAGDVGDYTMWVLANEKASNTVSTRVLLCRVAVTVDSQFHVGNPWSVRMTGGPPNTSVSLFGTSDGGSWTNPDWGRTGADGALVMTGTFPPGVEGEHTLRVRIGDESSNTLHFSVLP